MRSEAPLGEAAPVSRNAAAPDQEDPAALRIRRLSVRYGSTRALEDVSLDVPAGKVTAVMGPSGSGKSTLLLALNRLIDLVPSARVEGGIWIGEEEVTGMEVDLPALRRRVGMIFQKPNPFPLSVRRNLELPLKEHGVGPGETRAMRIEKALQEVGVWEEVKDRLDAPAPSLSGGQQQRLCIARALCLEPEILLLDEPTSHLDPMATRGIEELVGRLRRRCTVVIVTHDLAQARRVAHHAALFWLREGAGRLVETGPAERLLQEPARELTRAYLRGELG